MDWIFIPAYCFAIPCDRKDCGECEIKPKAEDNSGHHDYLGPWDRELYAADPRVLASASTPSDVGEARALSRPRDAPQRIASFPAVEAGEVRNAPF